MDKTRWTRRILACTIGMWMMPMSGVHVAAQLSGIPADAIIIIRSDSLHSGKAVQDVPIRYGDIPHDAPRPRVD